MPFKLVPVLTKKVFLELNSDEDPSNDTWVEIRQATQAEQEARAEITATATREYKTGSNVVAVTQRWTPEEQMRMEVFLTLAGTNILDENEKPVFVFRPVDGKKKLDMSMEAFAAVWGHFPSSVAKAIHDAVLEVNPQWNPKVN